jgi:hypothetical protein
MIPKEIEPVDLLIKVEIDEWKFELISTNWSGYWLVNLSNTKKDLVSVLIDLDELIAFCNSLKKCINASKNADYKAAEIFNLYEIVASGLPTPFNDEGAISILADWQENPVITLNFYNNREKPDELTARQSLKLDDAMEFFNLIAQVYNKFQDKHTWKPKL